MTATAESCSIPLRSDKPVVVRVKRKAFQSPIDAFWLEINERPLKRPLLDFGKLSISDSSTSRGHVLVKELETKKILVQHVETITSSKNSFDALRSFVSNSSLALELKEQNAEKRRTLKTVNKQDELLVKAKQRQEFLSRNARYEQIWRSRNAKKDAKEDEALSEICRLYDVVRVDVEEQEIEMKEKDIDLEDHMMMANYLPLLRDVLPTAAGDIERNIHNYISKQASSDDYVYDFYAVKHDAHVMEADSACQYPLVQVGDDDDYYDGPDCSEYGSDDSNGENNPLNDYPDEEISEDDNQATSNSSDEKSEDESITSDNPWEDSVSGSHISYEDSGSHHWSTDADRLIEDEAYSEGDNEIYDNEFWR